ncbi:MULTISPECIES: hypothetical protein [unclassified Arsukibacterium]|uniref:hypothetical protein n=1 Tax=unclassified Arsukibacterium TaxID=2635278 RepID=UPI000C386B84|nr:MULTISPECIES: hypothetical protein [unclassified Arsukibacterium]MAA95714.1 hypothetical protein [Rheinheimera sp.]MBM35355.1 hypothetical protein [Rheinheimera sp.]HAW92071.1 hypothetical protein [Candidatus Azambacteria bacterium]|tara:strand:+ start:654 stop:1598 length:945 start_codon:yes stop_codon:yes gene_type:complete
MQSSTLPSLNLPGYAQQQRQKQAALRARLQFMFNPEHLYQRLIQSNALGQDLSGVGIIFIDSEFTAVTLVESCRAEPLYLIMKEPPRVPVEQYATKLKQDQRESKVIWEAAGLVLSCSAMVLSWVVLIGGSAAIPLTGGVSAAGVVIAKAGVAITTVQCINATGRTIAESVAPEKLDSLDSNEWYTHTTLALDAISVGFAIHSSASLVKNYQRLKAASGLSPKQFLGSLNRQERKRITEEIIRLDNPSSMVSNRALKRMVRANQYPKRYNTVQINEAVRIRLHEAVANSITFGGSALGGSMKHLAIGLYGNIEQ